MSTSNFSTSTSNSQKTCKKHYQKSVWIYDIRRNKNELIRQFNHLRMKMNYQQDAAAAARFQFVESATQLNSASSSCSINDNLSWNDESESQNYQKEKQTSISKNQKHHSDIL